MPSGNAWTMLGSGLLLAAVLIASSSRADPVVTGLPGALQDGTANEQKDLSVRCRMSGICDGPPSPAQCSGPGTPSAAAAPGGGQAAERDAALACTLDPLQRSRRVVDAAAWAWKGYQSCGWGMDELRPLTCAGQHWLNLTLTAVDALDTLLLLGLEEQFNNAANLVTGNLAPHYAGDCNMFETTIRVLGGLLASAGLAAESHPQLAKRMLEQAADLGARLAMGFNSTSGIPHSDINLATGSTAGSVPHSSTSEVATLSLEFTMLSRLTGRPEYEQQAMAVHDALSKAHAAHAGLLPQHFGTADGMGHGSYIMLGARTDSYYEYLLKQWIMTGKQDDRLRQRFVESMQAVRARLLRHTAVRPAESPPESSNSTHSEAIPTHSTSVERPAGTCSGDGPAEAALPVANGPGAAGPGADGCDPGVPDVEWAADVQGLRAAQGGLLYVGEYEGPRFSPKMDHLVCFLPGVLALADFHNVSTVRPGTLDPPDLVLAVELAHTCHQLYSRSPTGLAPEIAHFTHHTGDSDYAAAHAGAIGGGDFNIKPADAHNLLRPETVESLYVLWKVTGDPVYREQAWSIFRAFERWTRVEGILQCLAADPPAAAAEVAKQAAAAASQAAATAIVEGRTPAQALEAAGAAADGAVSTLDLGQYNLLQQWYLQAIEQMAGTTARAAAANTVRTLVAAGKGWLSAAQKAGKGRAHVAVRDQMTMQLAQMGCLPTSNGGGYSALENTTAVPPPRRDKMESFFLSETLKYLYLIYAEPPDRCLHPSCKGIPISGPAQVAKFPLDKFVFTTEAHPLPVVGPPEASLIQPQDLSALLSQPYAQGGGAYLQTAAQQQQQEAKEDEEQAAERSDEEDDAEGSKEEEGEEQAGEEDIELVQPSSVEGEAGLWRHAGNQAAPPEEASGQREEL